MISQKQMLDIIATEAVEDWSCQDSSDKIGKPEKELPSVDYNLRVVIKKDGTWEWRD